MMLHFCSLMASAVTQLADVQYLIEIRHWCLCFLTKTDDYIFWGVCGGVYTNNYCIALQKVLVEL